MKTQFTLQEILTSGLPETDKFWWLLNECELTQEQVILVAVQCAKLALPIFESKFPHDFRPRVALDAAEKHSTTDQIVTAAYTAANDAYDDENQTFHFAGSAIGHAARADYIAIMHDLEMEEMEFYRKIDDGAFSFDFDVDKVEGFENIPKSNNGVFFEITDAAHRAAHSTIAAIINAGPDHWPKGPDRKINFSVLQEMDQILATYY